jgi:hypothetical protein
LGSELIQISLPLFSTLYGYYCGGESSSGMSSAGTSNKSKDKIRNTQRREIVGTDMGTKDRYINVKIYSFCGGWKKY